MATATKEYINSVKRTGKAKKAAKITISYTLMVAMLVFFLFPFFFMFFKSFMTNEESYSLPIRFFPSEWSVIAYKSVMDLTLLTYFKNTLFVILFNVIAVPLSAALCAYGFARVKFQGSEIMFGAVLATIMLPSIVIQIPLYVIFNSLNWIGTLYPLTIPNLFGGGAMNIFLIRQFIRGIPNTIVEAAILDGCSTFGIYRKIILPLIKPILLYLGVSTFIGNWNDFQGPLLYLGTQREYYTLSLALYQDFAQLGNGFLANSQMAVGIIMMIPCVILFALFKNQLLEGVAAIGVKG